MTPPVARVDIIGELYWPPQELGALSLHPSPLEVLFCVDEDVDEITLRSLDVWIRGKVATAFAHVVDYRVWMDGDFVDFTREDSADRFRMMRKLEE